MAKKPTRINPHIRWMIRRDMSETLAIEMASFGQPWYEEDFIRCLRQRNCIGMVAEYREEIVGFMIYELHKTRLVVLNFAVHPQYRRCKVGTAMIEKLLDKLHPDRRVKITLCVRETNLPAQLFFKKFGFRATQVLRDYYDDYVEDAYLMSHEITTAATV